MSNPKYSPGAGGRKRKEPKNPGAFTPKQMAYIEEFLRTGNKRRSAINSGYKLPTGITYNPPKHVKDEIDRRRAGIQASVQAKAIVDVEFVLRELRKIAEMPDLKVANKLGALREIADILGMKTTKVEHSFSGDVSAIDKEIAALMGGTQ